MYCHGNFIMETKTKRKGFYRDNCTQNIGALDIETEVSLFMDSYYTSVNLFLILRETNIKATGTVKKNRKGLSIKQMDNQILEYFFCFFGSDKLLLLKLNDQKEVYILTNYYGPKYN